MNIGGNLGLLVNSLGKDILVDNSDGTRLFTLANGMEGLAKYFEDASDEAGELFVGDDGDNRLNGLGRADTIIGNGGNDTLYGGRGNGNDRISGNDGDDQLYGGNGNDDMSGGAGNDDVVGGRGRDRLSGDGGDDILSGGEGDDFIFGGDGADEMYGGAGRDVFSVSFERGNLDRIVDFEIGKDRIALTGFEAFGDKFKKNDLSLDKIGKDLYQVKIEMSLFPNPRPAFEIELTAKEAKTFLNRADLGLTDKGGLLEHIGDAFEGLAGAGGLAGALGKMADKLNGTGKDDLLSGGKGDDTMKGKGGDDRMDGGVGNDKMVGGGGADVMDGGEGNDKLNGGGGDDRMSGGEGNDVLNGGGGDDWLTAGAGKDTLKGGAGDDVLVAGSGDSRLIGGAGADVFVLTKDAIGKASAVIQDYDPEFDTIKLLGVEVRVPESSIEANEIKFLLQDIGDAVGKIGKLTFDFSEQLLNVGGDDL